MTNLQKTLLVTKPVPGKLVVDMTCNRVVEVRRYGSDSTGREYVEVRLAGSYGARIRLPLSCVRPLNDEDRKELDAYATPIPELSWLK